LEARCPIPADFADVFYKWRQDAADVFLDLVWRAYDSLAKEYASVDLRDATENIERSITQQLEPRIRHEMSTEEPFDVQHGPYEEETRHSAKAQPPQYDIGFTLRAYPRFIWPLEAKVLKTPETITKYINEVATQFLKCRYSPFSSEAAMVGYLLSGLPSNALLAIESELTARVRCTFEVHPRFHQRPHKLSRHIRRMPRGKKYFSKFVCHHLILMFKQQEQGAGAKSDTISPSPARDSSGSGTGRDPTRPARQAVQDGQVRR
jgi:hypothetical protein